MKKKILILTACLLTVIASAFTFSSCRKILSETDKAVGNYVYKADESGEITVTKYLGKFTRIEIPEKIDGYTVKNVSPGIFSEVPGIKSVILPETITDIEAGIFSDCLALQSVTFRAPSVDIGDSAFKNCTSLTSINAKGGIGTVGNYAFSGCEKLEEVKADEGIKYIYSEAFKDCKSLKSIDISDNFYYIAASAFEGCELLSYGEYGNCYYLGNNKNPYAYLLRVKSTGITSCSIHKDTKVIAEGAFANCLNLSNVTINSSFSANPLFGFGEKTASQSVNLNITLGSNLDKIPYEFLNSNYVAPKIKSLTFTDGINVSEIGNVHFYDFVRLESIVFPKGVNYIGSNTFNGCKNLKTVTLPEGIETIEYAAFKNCAKLSSINIPSTVHFIGPYAFENCASLSSVIIPQSVVTVDIHAFRGCTALTVHTAWPSLPSGWSIEWNSSNLPVVWGVEE